MDKKLWAINIGSTIIILVAYSLLIAWNICDYINNKWIGYYILIAFNVNGMLFILSEHITSLIIVTKENDIRNGVL